MSWQETNQLDQRADKDLYDEYGIRVKHTFSPLFIVI